MNEPVTIMLDARKWQFYSGGIYNSCDSQSSVINHAVLLVGYQIDTYYKVKNSWGVEWGENGFMRIVVDDTDSCGVCDYVSFTYNYL